jgi:D-cysteine desulfhydrase
MRGGPTIWVKRDDLTGFGLTGNKVRKLEYHLAAAVDAGADTVVTCGAAQSNHCRSTALACARLGLRAVLLLRTPDGRAPERIAGNHLLDLLAGAEVRYITPQEYAGRVELMAATADEQAAIGHVPWVIPEGASDALGMWGFVTAMTELADQMSAVPNPVAIWHAASSGGTTAGLGWAADRIDSAVPVIGSSVGDTVPELTARIDTIWAEALTVRGGGWPTPTLELTDDHLGLGYGLTTADELRTQREVSAATGLIFDPTYTGKAVHGLRRAIDAGRFGPDDDVIFWHTGGGFAVFAHPDILPVAP